MNRIEKFLGEMGVWNRTAPASRSCGRGRSAPRRREGFPLRLGSLCVSRSLSPRLLGRRSGGSGQAAGASRDFQIRALHESATAMAPVWTRREGKGDSCGGALGRISYLSSGSDWHAPRPWWDRLWFSMPGRGRKANVPCSDWAQPTGRLARGPSWRGAPNQQPPALRLERERVGRPSR